MMNNISSSPYLSGYTYRTLAFHAICDAGDTKYMKNSCKDGIHPESILDGHLVYVTGNQVCYIFKHIAPTISKDIKYSVITAQWDEGVTDKIIPLLPDNLHKWYTINANKVHDKIVPIPLGLQNLHWRKDGNIQSEPNTYAKYSQTKKDKDIFMSFSTGNNYHERSNCVEQARIHLPNNRITYQPFTPQDRKDEGFVDKYFQNVSRYKMVLCPWGAGKDTHRLWETMYLGSIPITRMCTAYRDFADYPIIFVDKWSDLNFDNLLKEYEIQLTKLQSDTRIYIDYWRSKINLDRQYDK